jgi:hypothetical protein
MLKHASNSTWHSAKVKSGVFCICHFEFEISPAFATGLPALAPSLPFKGSRRAVRQCGR